MGLSHGDLFTSLVSFSSGLVDGQRGDDVAWTGAAQRVSYPLLTLQAGRQLKEFSESAESCEGGGKIK